MDVDLGKGHPLSSRAFLNEAIYSVLSCNYPNHNKYKKDFPTRRCNSIMCYSAFQISLLFWNICLLLKSQFFLWN
jgi:hypothetical protein